MCAKPIIAGMFYDVDGRIIAARNASEAIEKYIEVMIRAGVWN